MVSTCRTVSDLEQSAILRHTATNHPPRCRASLFRNSSNFEANPGPSPHSSGNNGFQPALFRTWKFSVRPTNVRATRRNFKLGWRLKWEDIFPPPWHRNVRHLHRRFENLTVTVFLSLSLSAVVLKGIHFSFFREKLLIPRKCRDTATAPNKLGCLFKYEISNEMYIYIYIHIFDQSSCAFRYEGMNI